MAASVTHRSRTPQHWHEVVVALIPGPTHLLAQLGEPVTVAYLRDFVATYDDAWLMMLTSADDAPRSFASIWNKVQGRASWEPLELLLCEHWISTRPAEVAQHLPNHMSFTKTLHTVRGCVGVYLYNRAKDVTWREPFTFVRALRAADTYLSGSVANEAMTSDASKASFSGKLGAARVLRSRYEDLDNNEIIGAVRALEASVRLGNDTDRAKLYLAEAYAHFYDRTGDPQSLLKVRQALSGREKSAHYDELQCIDAEVWLRLTERAETKGARVQFADLAIAGALPLFEAKDSVIVARAAIVHSIAKRVRASGERFPVSGLRLPFGVRAHMRSMDETSAPAIREVLKGIVKLFAESNNKAISDPLARRVEASVRSAIAEFSPSLRNEERARWLRSAIEVRKGKGSQRPLTDPESELENVLDLIAEYGLTRQERSLLNAAHAALRLSEADVTWPTPMLVLGRAYLEFKVTWSQPAKYELTREHRRSALLDMVVAADPQGLFEFAAKRALDSLEVDRRNLGGRAGVYLAEDFSGAMGEDFVFKPTTVHLADYEDARVDVIRTAISRKGLSRRFAVATTIARSPIPAGDPLTELGSEVLVAKTFHSGQLLPIAVRDRPAAERLQILEQVIDFLALIHACGEATDSCRKVLWKKELGWWLRALRVDDRAAYFSKWWAVLEGLPQLPRRDAHPRNWLYTPKHGVVALDLEAHGCRPVGYELAQLTDDEPLLSVDEAGWAERRHLVRRYRNSLAKNGIDVALNDLLLGYECALVSRSIRLLTNPLGGEGGRAHGIAMLEWLAASSVSAEVRDLSSESLRAWKITSATFSSSDVGLSPSRRRRLSKALSYELRHGTTAAASAGGWVDLEELLKVVNDNGHRTSTDELLMIAQSIDERRFEVDGARVRARYGHTNPVAIEYPKAHPAGRLFHGTAFASLERIISAGEGLRPMGRQFVHLSADPQAALLTALRHGPGVLLAVETTQLRTVYAAGGTVYLTEQVPAQAIEVVPPSYLFLHGLKSVD